MKIEDNQRPQLNSNIYEELPPVIKPLFDKYTGRERDLLLLSTITVLSNCLPNIRGQYAGSDIYPHLYLMIIAPAASGKGLMNLPRKLIDPIHSKIRKDSLESRAKCLKANKGGKSQNPDDCPEAEIKIVPANISSSELYSYLQSTKHGLIMIESEADTLSKMLVNDWSNFSDVLRKTFHHETLSLSRKLEKEYIEINNPKLSVMVSGTPDQLQPLVKNQTNGLFSRFMIYSFDDIAPFKNVFSKDFTNQKAEFKTASETLLELYGRLIQMPSVIEFEFSLDQQQFFYDHLDFIRTDIIENHTQSFVPNVHRAGVIWFRVAMILSAIRNGFNENYQGLVVPQDVDFYTAFSIMKVVLRHSQYTFNSMSEHGLSIQDSQLLALVSNIFTTKQAVNAGASMGIPERTVYDKLKQLKAKRIVKQISKGKYSQSI